MGALGTEQLPIGRRARRPAAAATAMRHGGKCGARAGDAAAGDAAVGAAVGMAVAAAAAAKAAVVAAVAVVVGVRRGDPGRSRSELAVQTFERRWPALDVSATGPLVIL